MEEGKLAKWLVKEGDEVKSSMVIAEIETDKATMEVEAVDEGRIGRILVPEGTEGVVTRRSQLFSAADSGAPIPGSPEAARDVKQADSRAFRPRHGRLAMV